MGKIFSFKFRSRAMMILVVGGALLSRAPGIAAVSTEDGSTNLASSPFAPTVSNSGPAPTNAPPGMVWIPGGEFSMGCVVPNNGICSVATMNSVNDAQPIHRVYVDGFWMDKTDLL